MKRIDLDNPHEDDVEIYSETYERKGEYHPLSVMFPDALKGSFNCDNVIEDIAKDIAVAVMYTQVHE